MADLKISQLTLATPDDTDVIPFVDISDTTMGVGGTTKKSTKADLKGAKGDPATATAGTTTTLTPGASATVTNVGTTSDAVFDFGIPEGDKGDSATITVGTVTTVSPSTPATVTNSGTSTEAIFDFEIPKGETGTNGVSYLWKGTYNAGTTYSANDCVAYNGTSYIYINVTPASGQTPADNTYWDILALKGTNGAGTLESVVAGTGISVDDTDPANPIVTSTITQATRDSLGIDTDDNVTFAAIKITTGASLGKVLTSDADGDGSWTTPSVGGSSLWTLMPGTPTRVGNTSFTVTGDVTTYVAKGMIVKWTESAAVKVGMVSIPSTYGAPNTTITIIGDTMVSIDASSLKYCMLGAEMFQKNFAIAGNIGAVATDVANIYYATEPMRVLGADLQTGTEGYTNSTTIDINASGTTMFTTKPTLATTVNFSPTPFTANSGTSLSLGARVTIDIDAYQTTNAVDLYVQLYVFPERYLYLN